MYLLLEKGLLFLGFEIFKTYFSKPVALFRNPFCRKSATKSDHGLMAMHFIGFQALHSIHTKPGFPSNARHNTFALPNRQVPWLSFACHVESWRFGA
jgi:hypothetical protein